MLYEIRHALQDLLETGESRVVDLRSIPLAPGEEEKLINLLGCGEVVVKLEALGLSEIYETQYPGVWLVTHFNTDSSIIGRFVEITLIPEILKAQQEDMKDSLLQLDEALLSGDDREVV
ncbi:MAG: hydrogenase expression/formation protein [Gammaproteobacteria bacterium]|nr:hydrogenase expression/formation protein [Gammaproteobacteria bacterium]